MTDARWDLIAHIREQIEAGTYTSPARLRVTVGIITDHLNSGENVEKSVDKRHQTDLRP